MSALFATPTRPTGTAGTPDLHLGQAVHVNSRAAWLPATVTSIAHTRIGVTYRTAQPRPLGDAVAPWVVRPANGVRLQPVHALRTGDEVVAFDGTIHTVASVWQGCDGWYVVGYTDGEHASVPPGAILRLSDPTPQVTVDGLPV
jgi:hypothetical protein